MAGGIPRHLSTIPKLAQSLALRAAGGGVPNEKQIVGSSPGETSLLTEQYACVLVVWLILFVVIKYVNMACCIIAGPDMAIRGEAEATEVLLVHPA